MGQTGEIATSIKFINQKCGLCSGFGTLKYGELVCRACSGRGVVSVDQETGQIITQEEK